MKWAGFLASTAVGALAFASSAVADTAGTSSGHYRIETVIVTGERPREDKVPMKATFTQSTIPQEKILNASPGPATTIQTLLNTEPSIYATTGGANGMETNIKFRSFADGEFGETFAGVPLNDIFNSGVTYQADNRNNVLLVTRDLEAVQIYRGVNNPAVNTYNSLGGTINFVPRQPTEEMGGDIGVDGGSFDTINYHATFNTGDWHGIEQTVSFERDYSSSWHQNSADMNDNLYYAGKADTGFGEVFGYFTYNANRGNAPQFIPVNLINQFGQAYQWPTNVYRSVNWDSNYLGVFGFRSDLTDFLTVENEGYIGDNNYKRTSFSVPNSSPLYPGPYFLDDQGSGFAFWTGWMGYDPNVVFGSSVAGTDYHFYGYDGRLYGDRVQVTADLPFNKIIAGGDFNVGELHSREYWYGAFNMPMVVGYNDAWDEHDTRQMWSAYIQDDIHLWDDRIHITPGVKYVGSVSEDNDAIGIFYLPPGSIHADAHFLSPTVGASVEVIPDLTIYGSYGKNVKFPDITALYNELGFGGAVPPVIVKPEFAEDYEAGIRYKWENLQAALNFYNENFTHIIFSFPVPGGFGATAQANGGGERFRGAELELTDDFGEIYVGNWKGYLNASYNEAFCTTPTSNVLTGGSCAANQGLANVPNYLVNAGLTWDWDGWHVDVQGHYVGRQLLQDFNTGLPKVSSLIQPGQPVEIPDYFLLNLGIVKVVPVDFGPAHALRFALHVDNLFDKRYFSDAQTNTDTNNTILPGGTQLNDVYALTGEPRAVFGSVSIYF